MAVLRRGKADPSKIKRHFLPSDDDEIDANKNCAFFFAELFIHFMNIELNSEKMDRMGNI